MANGIIVVRIDPQQTLEILTLSSTPEEALGQIAEFLEYPSDVPISSGNYVVYEAQRPENTIVVWHNIGGRSRGGRKNFMPSNGIYDEHGFSSRGSTICGDAILTGLDSERKISSVPLRKLAGDLHRSAYRDAAQQVTTWCQSHGL